MKEFILQFAPWVIGLIMILLFLKWLSKPRKKGAKYSSPPGEGKNQSKPKGRMNRFGKVGSTGRSIRKS